MKEEIEDKMIDDALEARRIRAEVMALHQAKKKAAEQPKQEAKIVTMSVWRTPYRMVASVALILGFGAAAWHFTQKPNVEVVNVEKPLQNVEKPIQNTDNQPIVPIVKDAPIVKTKPKEKVKIEFPKENNQDVAIYAAVDDVFSKEINAIPSSLKGSNDDADFQQFTAAKQALKQQKIQEAIRIFQTLIAKNFEEKEECEWWLTLAILKTNPKEGIKRLELIANDANKLFHNKAKVVLGNLKK